MNRTNPPTAIFCYSDMLAAGTVKCLLEHNLIPGKDVDVIGFDDLFFSRYSRPEISTVRQPCFDMGRIAFELLRERIENPDTIVQEVVLPSELILRETTRQLV